MMNTHVHRLVLHDLQSGGGGCLPGARPACCLCIDYPGFNPGSPPPPEKPPKSTRVDRKPSLQRTTRFPVSTETTKAKLGTALGSPKVLP